MKEQKWKNQYIMFDLTRLNNEIWYWDNTISYPKEFLELINNLDLNTLSYSMIPKWENWFASNDSEKLYGQVKNIKSDSVNQKNIDDRIYQNSLYIINSLKMAAEMCFDQYLNARSLDKSKYYIDLSYVPVKKWNPVSSMGPHFDGGPGFENLEYTTVTYLNDDYKGGEIVFPNDNITLKPKAGSTIMFPSSTIHQVNPVISGNRYTSTNSINMI